MGKVIRLTESDLMRIVKRVIIEHDDMSIFFRRRFNKYEVLIDYKMREMLKFYCKGSNKAKRKKEFVDKIKDFIYEHIERFDVSNIMFDPFSDDYSEGTKDFEKIFNSFFLEKIERFFNENCKK